MRNNNGKNPAANDISLSNYKTEWSDEPYVSINESVNIFL